MKRTLAGILICCLMLTLASAYCEAQVVTRQAAVAAVVHMIGLNSFPDVADLTNYADEAQIDAGNRAELSAAVAAGLYPVDGDRLLPDQAIDGASLNALLTIDTRLSGLGVDADVSEETLETLLNEIDAALTDVTPQENFYLWANRITLRSATPGPDDAWTLYSQERADAIAEEKAQTLDVCAHPADSYAPDSAAHRLSYLYAQMNDSDARNAAGTGAMQTWLDAIDACASPQALWELLADMELKTGVTGIISLLPVSDEDTNELRMCVSYFPFGLLMAGDVSDEQAAGYRKLSLALYSAAGLNETDGAVYDQMLDICTQIAAAPAWQDSDDVQITLAPAAVDEAMTGLTLSSFLTAFGLDPESEITMDNNQALVCFTRLLTDENLPAYKLMLKHMLLQNAGIYLSDDIALATQALSEYTNWCMIGDDEPFAPSGVLPYLNLEGDALYSYLSTVNANQDTIKLFVETCVPEEAFSVAEEVTHEVRAAFAERLLNNGWMNDETRTKALDKLDKIIACLVDYSTWRHITESATLAESMLSLNASALSQNIASVNDHNAYALVYHENPDVVNACYVPEKNAIDVPGALFRWPFYVEGDRVQTLGALGSVIGHELTHGFDPIGSQYDSAGLIDCWWTNADTAAFNERVTALEDYYNSFEYRDGKTQDASQTSGEAMADIGGLEMVMDILKDDTEAQRAALTAFAQIWAIAATDDQLDDLAQSDVHPVKTMRVNAAVAALDEFYSCFDVQEGDAMYVAPEKRPQIW